MYKILLPTLFLLSFCDVFSQGSDNPLGLQVLPPSPEIASFQKYGAIPVSYYTGLPNISVPLGTLYGRELNIAFTLSYHASGIRVEETASRVGLGWTLNAGGAISRSVRGLPDESGWLTNAVSVDSVVNMSTEDRNFYLASVLGGGTFDAEPDLFYFNFGGRSGKFFFDKNGEAVITPGMDIKIEWSGINQWKITDEQGSNYFFGETSAADRTSFESTQVSSTCGGNSTVKSAWYLIETISAFNTDTIAYYYAPYAISYCTKDSESDYWNLTGSICSRDPQICGSQKQISGSKLKSVASSLGSVEFVYGAPRLDLPGDSTLASIIHYNLNGSLVRSFDLEYDYTTSTGPLTDYGYCASVTSDEARRKRLQLLKVTETDGADAITPPYEFEYETSLSLPERFSNAQDHWGYYNGRNNDKLVPSYEYHLGNTHILIDGADRRPDTTKIKAGTLNKITYPTGGYTEFEFESNQGTTAFLEPKKDYVNTSSLIGDGTTQYYELPFSIDMHYANGVFVEPVINGVTCDVLESSCDISFKIEGVTDTSFEQYITPVSANVYLPDGDYKLIVETQNNNADSKYFGVFLTWLQDNLDVNRFAGGLRIKRMITSDGQNPEKDMVKVFHYEDSNGNSYGHTGSFPIYEYFFNENQRHTIGEVTQYEVCNFVSRSSVSSVPLATTNGSYVGYSKVKVLEGEDAENGQSVYTYTNFDAYPDAWDANYPYKPLISFDYNRGLLLSEEHFEKRSDSLYIREKVTYTYQDKVLTSEENTLALIAFRDPINVLGTVVPTPQYEDYLLIPGLKVPSEKIATSYFYNSSYTSMDSLVNSEFTSYESDYHRMPTSVTVLGSDKHDYSKIKYTSDYSSGISTGLDDLINAHSLLPIERQLWKVSASDTILSESQVTLFDSFNGITRRSEIKRALVKPAITISNVSEAVNANSLYTSLLPSGISYQTEVTFDKYDAYGRPIQYSDVGGVSHSFVWGYNRSLPTGHFIGAIESKVDFIDFEEGEAIDWTGYSASQRSSESYTGAYGYDGSISKSLPTDTYEVIVAAKGGGSITVNGESISTTSAWEVYHWITNTNNIQVTPSSGVTIDHVRLHPVSAQASSVTYVPLVGVNARMDENGKVTFYQYDRNRLSLIKDYDGYIMNRFQYNFLTH